MSSLIAVAGASGQLGQLVVQRLKTKTSTPIVALARKPESVAALGVETRVFNYDDESTLAPALAGVTTLLLISSSEVFKPRAVQHLAVINAAKAAHVKHIVYTSAPAATTTRATLAHDHKVTEEALVASGINYTILRNGWYHENAAGAIKGALFTGSIPHASGKGLVSAASRADYADAAVAVLSAPEGTYDGRVIELAGDSGYSKDDLAAEISKQTGKTITATNLPVEEYSKILQGLGLPETFANLLADSDAVSAEGWLFNDSKELSTLIGHPTTTLADYVTSALAAPAPSH